MNQPAITVSGVGKKFVINHERGRYIALRDVLTGIARRPFSFMRTKMRQATGAEGKEEFWALKAINFEIKKGEVLGIIGRNGSGKSTLLKTISQITPPTTGEIRIIGRVGSLLEVGTGFHPELTGRENIFLNGAILGMKRVEIAKKFDEIVEFAGIGQFLDTPVKKYSSGMYVRLAFSVAAHMEPDILLVDEVLAVGDTEFQNKCLGKMDEITKKEGRTILFVSHNMLTVEQLCKKVIILKNGSIDFIGPTKEGIERYLNPNNNISNQNVWGRQASGNDIVRIKKVFSHDKKNGVREIFSVKEKVGITIEYEALTEDDEFVQGISLHQENGNIIFYSHDVAWEKPEKIKRKKGLYSSTAWIPGNFLPDGLFSVGILMFQPNPLVVHTSPLNVLFLRITDDFGLDTARGIYQGDFPGIIRPKLDWETRKIN